MALGLDQPQTSPGSPLAREHNDDGNGGICTWCGRLHTAMIVPACSGRVKREGEWQRCLDPVRRPGDVLCEACAVAHLNRVKYVLPEDAS